MGAVYNIDEEDHLKMDNGENIYRKHLNEFNSKRIVFHFSLSRLQYE